MNQTETVSIIFFIATGFLSGFADMILALAIESNLLRTFLKPQKISGRTTVPDLKQLYSS